MEDIGSIFPIYDQPMGVTPVGEQSRRQYFSLCRELLYAIACKHRGERNAVLLPAFTCKVVVEAFEQAHYDIAYFAIDRTLRINKESFVKTVENAQPTMIVVHPYFGMELSEMEESLLKHAKSSTGSVIVLDNTQCACSEKRYPFVDYYVASIRKWLPIPDGAELISGDRWESAEGENTEFVQCKRDAMYLRGLYFTTGDEETKSISRRLDGRSSQVLEEHPIALHKINDYSAAIVYQADWMVQSKVRMQNVRYLYEGLKDTCQIALPIAADSITTAPLLFPILVPERSYWQKCLAEQHIYAQYLWPTPNEDSVLNEDIRYLYDHHLVLSIDQRYSIDDMNRIIETIKKHDYETK